MESANRASSVNTRFNPTPFVGRERELSFVQERLDSASGGAGGSIFIAGESGVGKSRLLAEIGVRASASGWLVLGGRAYDTAGMPPYLPFVEALRQHLSASPDDELATLLKDLPEIATLIPEIHGRVPDFPARSPISPEAERLRLFDGVSTFLVRVARATEAKGLLLCLDDLHWSDRSTLSLLIHFARKLRNERLLLLGAYRSEEAVQPKPLADVLVELNRERLDERISLKRFSLDETVDLIEGMTGTATDLTVSTALHAQTDGNAFFVEELVRQLQAEMRDLGSAQTARDQWQIPEGVRAVIGQRVARVSDDARRVLQAGAVVGDGFLVPLVQAISDLSPAAVVDALEEATDAALLKEDGTHYVFSHPLIRQVLYEGLSLARLQQLHARTAEAMQARSPSGGEESLASIGHHWRLGGHPEHAIEFLLRAGDAAITLTAWTEAAAYWEAAERCMEETGGPTRRRARLMEGVGDLYFLSSFGAQDCVAQYEQAAALYEGAGDELGAARAHSRAGRSLTWPTSGFDYPAAIEQLRIAERYLANGPDSIELGEIYAALAHAESHALLSRPDEMLTAMHRLKGIADALDNDYLRVGAYSLEGHYLGLQGHLAQGLELEERACEAARALDNGSVNRWPDRWRDFLLAYSSADDQALDKDAGSFVLSRWYGRLLMTRWTASCCGLQSLELNDPIKARAPHDTIRDPQGRLINPLLFYDLFLSGDTAAIRQMSEAGTRELSAANDVILYGPALLAWCEGRWQEVRTFLESRLERYRAQGSNSLASLSNRWLIRLYRTIEDTEKAKETLETSLAISLKSGAVKFEFPCRVELALHMAEAGRLSEASPHIARMREILAEGEDWRGLAGRAALAEAAIAAAQAEHEVAAKHFEHALEVFRRFSLPWDEAEASEIWARSCRGFYRGRGRRAFVADKLQAARAIYERIGAGQPWLERLDAQARRLVGGRAAGDDYPDSLTEREVEVLKLIAGGKSNREMADTLVVSVRTIERHITHVYGKIGARGRADATTYALSHSLI
jgi:DNA-binding CsgD family transcriptional regulator